MHLDVIEIKDFYSKRLGQMVRRNISQKIHAHWPKGGGASIAGMGYATPYLRSFLPETSHGETSLVAHFSPGAQGGVIWPTEGPLRSVLFDEDMFPLADACFDRILEVHGLEFCFDVNSHLREIWRVLKPEGRLLLIVPNRAGLWARVDTTPFGYGQPFSRGQLRDLLVRSWFRPLSIEPLVHFAPFQMPLGLTASRSLEKVGSKIWPRFSGMLMVEAIKEVQQPIGRQAFREKKFKTAPIRVQPVPA